MKKVDIETMEALADGTERDPRNPSWEQEEGLLRVAVGGGSFISTMKKG